MKFWFPFSLLALALNTGWAQDKKTDEAFIVRPYLQIGAAPGPLNIVCLRTIKQSSRQKRKPLRLVRLAPTA